MEDIHEDSPEFKAAVVTMRLSNHTQNALEEAARVRVSHIRHNKGGTETSDSDRIFEELTYERFLEPRPDVAFSDYDSVHIAVIDKTLECSLLANVKPADGATFARTNHTDLPPTVLPRNAVA
jgi:hypothetical protein